MRQITAKLKDKESIIKYLAEAIHRYKGDLEINIEEDFDGVDIFYIVRVLTRGGMDERIRRYGTKGA